MENYNAKLADALERARAASRSKHADILCSDDLKPADRKLLLAGGWLHEVIQGWYLLLRPDAPMGDSTPWYAHFWEFLSVYLTSNCGDEYTLSAESSLLLHTGSTLIPSQVVVITPSKGLKRDLPHNTSMFAYPDPNAMPKERTLVKGLQCMTLPYALCKVGPRFFQADPEEAAIALSLVGDPAEFVEVALQYGLPRGIGRVIGAYRALGRESAAAQIRRGLQGVGLDFREENPFADEYNVPLGTRSSSPYAKRIETMWRTHRQTVIAAFGEVTPREWEPGAYLEAVDAVYAHDAYNSLSIEGYHVTEGLIERVLNHNWDLETSAGDAAGRDALAARGYYEAFQAVRQSVSRVLEGAPAGEQLELDLPTWYSSLWAPSVRARILEPQHVTGYRRGEIFIRGSIHVPPPREAVADAMDMFFKCLQEEEHAGVRAVLGHFAFVYIHPYMDGNGRIGRFIMNLMLASGGYDWTIVRVERCQTYMRALEHMERQADIGPFVRFILEEMEASASSGSVG